jgi:hypothetical protein
VLVRTPLYFLFDAIGRQDPPAITHPQFFCGFAGARWRGSWRPLDHEGSSATQLSSKHYGRSNECFGANALP